MKAERIFLLTQIASNNSESVNEFLVHVLFVHYEDGFQFLN